MQLTSWKDRKPVVLWALRKSVEKQCTTNFTSHQPRLISICRFALHLTHITHRPPASVWAYKDRYKPGEKQLDYWHNRVTSVPTYRPICSHRIGTVVWVQILLLLTPSKVFVKGYKDKDTRIHEADIDFLCVCVKYVRDRIFVEAQTWLILFMVTQN